MGCYSQRWAGGLDLRLKRHAPSGTPGRADVMDHGEALQQTEHGHPEALKIVPLLRRLGRLVEVQETTPVGVL